MTFWPFVVDLENDVLAEILKRDVLIVGADLLVVPGRVRIVPHLVGPLLERFGRACAAEW